MTEPLDLEPVEIPGPWSTDPAREPGDPQPPAPRPHTGAIVGLVAIMLIAGITGFAVTSRLRDDTPFSSAAADNPRTLPTIPAIPSGPSGSSGSTPRLGSDPDASVLREIGVQQTDVGSGASVEIIPNGDRVGSTTTLDLCNGTYPSESLRRARLQVLESDAAGDAYLSTEAVLYRNPAAAAQAMAELRDVRARCPHAPVASPVGEDTATTTFRAPPDKAWPATATVERLAYDFDTVDLTGKRSHSMAVYLRRGRLLMGVYFAKPDGPQPAVAGQTTIAGIEKVFADRIAGVPAAIVNRHA